MESNDRNQLPNGDAASNRDIDWSRYGLHSAETQRSNELRRNNGQYEELGPEMYQTGANELFAQEYVSNLFSENKALPLPFNMCLLVSEFRSILGGNQTSSFRSLYCLEHGTVCLHPVLLISSELLYF